MKVVDPTCGSGAFLVAAFEFLHDEYARVNGTLAELKADQFGLFDLDREILTQNLYGVDINAESIEITKLSLWLKTARYGKELNTLDHNLRVGDSLLEGANHSDPTPNPSPKGRGESPLSFGEGQGVRSVGAGSCAFRWNAAFPEVFEQGGFDVVLGNPPYVRQEFFSHLKPLLQKQYDVYNGVADLYTYFFERGLRLLKPNGKLGYISSSTFFKTGSGQNLRRYLAANAAIETIVDFGDMQVFEGVTTYPAILILANAKPGNNHAVRFLALQNVPEDDLTKAFDIHAATMLQTSLNQEKWQLDADGFASLRKKISSERKMLKDVYSSPLYGIKTGFNEAFVIDRTTHDRLIAEDPKSADIIMPFLEGKDLKKWHIEPKDLWIIFIPWHFPLHLDSSITGISEVAEEEFKNKYPAIYNHLAQHKTALSNRNKAETGIRYEWYALQRWAASYYQILDKPKIIYPDISQGAKFSLDKKGSYFGNTTYFIPTDDYFLLGIMNSKVIWFYLHGVCEALRGGIWRLRLFSINIETIPIPDATDAQKAAIADLAQRCQQTAEACYAAQDAVRRRIPDLCPPERNAVLNTKLTNWWTLDFAEFRAEIKKCFKADIPLAARNEWEQWLAAERKKIEEYSATLNNGETELNRQVYALFDLTPDEIRLIEAEIKG